MSVARAGLDEIINESRDAREVKRALCVKMALGSLPVAQLCALLNVSAAYVSKWRGLYEAHGVAALALGYAGSQSYLTDEQRTEVITWLQGQPAPTVAGVRNYVEERHQVVYQSCQSYYELMHATS
jgi:putative transposase